MRTRKFETLDDVEDKSGGGCWTTFLPIAGLGILMQISALFLNVTGRLPSGRAPRSGRAGRAR